MKNNHILCKLFCIIIFCTFFLTACVYDRGVILLNKEPITKNNALTGEKVFSTNQNIYYLFIAPNKMKNEFIRVQVFKIIESASWGGADIVRTKDYRLMKDERYYHADNLIFYERGRYVIQIFSTKDFQHPLAVAQFYIR